MNIFFGCADDYDAAIHNLEAWEEGSRDTPCDTKTLALSGEVNLYTGGNTAFTDACLPPQYHLVERLLCPNGNVVGYHFYELTDDPTLRAGELAFAETWLDGDTFVCLALPFSSTQPSVDPLLGDTFEPPRLAVGSRLLPERKLRPLSLNDTSKLINSATADMAIAYLAGLGITLQYDVAREFQQEWASNSVRGKIEDLYAIFAAHHFDTLGDHGEYHSSSSDWPVDTPSLSDLPNTSARLDEAEQVASARNALHFLPVHSKMYRISASQQARIESSLLCLGQRSISECEAIGQQDMWAGRLGDGQKLMCSGSFEVGDCTIHVVTIPGGAIVGTEVYRGSNFSDYVGTVDATLWKLRNHNHNISPEEQRGTALVVTR